MAHIGKNYKLHFRRDFAMGVSTYRVGMPEAWRADGEVQVTTPAIKQFVFPQKIATPTSDVESAEQRWQTDLFTVHGLTMRHRLVVNLAVLDNGYPEAFWEVRDDANVLRLRSSQRRGSLANANIGRFVDLFTAPLFFDAAWWGGDFRFANNDFRFAGWQIYNP